MVTGAMEIVEGLNSFIAGIGGTVAADASGVACVASGVTLTITVEGVVTIVDGGYAIYNGVVAIQGDSRQYRDAKGADRKASGGGTNVGNISEKLDTNNIHNMTKQDIIDSIPDDWTYTDNNGFVHIRDADGNMRIRIAPSDKVTNYPHVHVYDDAGNLLDSAGNIVDRKSQPDTYHIKPIKE